MPIDLGDIDTLDRAIEGYHLDQVEEALAVLLRNIFTDTSHELLSHWERVLGITPTPDANVTSRITACVAKIRETGGISRGYFKKVARDLGYEIEIYEQHAGFEAGVDMAGYPLENSPWVWRVHVTSAPAKHYFEAGISSAGDRLLSFGIVPLEQKIEDLKPAHTQVYFTYPE